LLLKFPLHEEFVLASLYHNTQFGTFVRKAFHKYILILWRANISGILNSTYYVVTLRQDNIKRYAGFRLIFF